MVPLFGRSRDLGGGLRGGLAGRGDSAIGEDNSGAMDGVVIETLSISRRGKAGGGDVASGLVKRFSRR